MTFNLDPFTFDELPLHSYTDGNGIEHRIALVDGQCDVEYDRDGNWNIRAIQLEAWAPATRETCYAHLDPREPLYTEARKAIEKHCADRITDDVRDTLCEHGIHLHNANKEHRLTKRELV